MEPFELESGIKEAMEMVQSGSAIDRGFESVIGEVGSQFGDIEAKLSSIPSQINGIADDIVQKANGIAGQVTAAANRIPAFAAHVEGQFNNLMNNIDTFAASQGLKNALNGKSGCSEMSSFFGSITKEGPKIMGEVNKLVGDVKGEIDKFVQLGQSLQGQITSAKDGLLTQINSEIARVTDLNTKARLEAIKTRLNNEFQTGVTELRAELSREAMNLLPADKRNQVQGAVTQMRNTDFSILTSSESIQGIAGKLDSQTSSLQQIITGEQNALNGAVSQLEQFGAVSSMKSLLKTNTCVQTIMGFVGKGDFLKKLGG